VDRYIKFVKERTEIEQNYAKQLRSLSKKYAKRGSKDEQDCKFSNHASFQEILNELNDYAGQRELIAENMMTAICVELTKYLQDIKQERKTHLSDAKKAQQTLESSFKQLESVSPTLFKIHHTLWFHWVLSECVETNKEQRVQKHDIDSILFIEQHKSGFERPGDVEFEDYTQGIKPATSESSLHPPKVRAKLWPFSKKHKFVPPSFSPPSPFPLGSLPLSLPLSKLQRSPLSLCLREFNQSVKPRISTLKMLHKPCSPPAAEDFSHLPPEQRKKRLQAKIDDITKELQKTQDQSDALEKMKGVYEQNPQMGDPSSLEPQITETAQTIGRLKGELAKYEVIPCSYTSVLILYTASSKICRPVKSPPLSTAVTLSAARAHQLTYNSAQTLAVTADPSQNIYTEFDYEFDDVESPIGQCTALYTFEGNSEGTISITEGELLSVMEEDKGDGWMRVLRGNGEEGYIPSSYVKLTP
uniref:Thyroid hormone receptor interactor 10 n=1 Tax=Stegastes partitus TaxID=144197 RepID=A0A3B5AFB7_9TELE